MRRSAASSGTASSTEARRPPVFAVILSGGSGTRLWPLARAAWPKQFLPLCGGRSLFEAAVSRGVRLAGAERTLVVTGRAHARLAGRQAPEVPARNVILEGEGRNTAAAVALAARLVRARAGDGIMVVMPSDHFIRPEGAFRATIRRAIEAVRGTSALVTLGVPAARPETGFGYIRPASPRAGGASRVLEFVEKPAAAHAARMARSRRYLWNTGIFAWRASVILEALAQHSPRLARAVQDVPDPSPGARWRVPADALRRIPSQPIDRAVLEKSRDVRVVRAGFAWSDLGSWAAFRKILRRDRNGNASLGRALAVESGGCLAVADRGLVVLVGVRDLAVVRSGDAVLVCGLESAQRVRDAASRLRGALSRYA